MKAEDFNNGFNDIPSEPESTNHEKADNNGSYGDNNGYYSYGYSSNNSSGNMNDGGRKKKKKKNSNKMVAVLVICAILAFALLLAAAAVSLSDIKENLLGDVFDDDDAPSSKNTFAERTGVVIYNDDSDWINDGQMVSNDAIVNATYRVIDSVVAITTETVSYNSYYGNYVSTGAGSGVVIAEKCDSDGNPFLSYIITNNHVIDGASSIKVTLSNGDTFDAVLVGTDSQTDIAVITIQAVGLTKASFGDSSELKLGQSAIAIGNPLGSLAGTVTSGIISCLEREVKIDGVVMSLIQTSAPINPGNSGGGLFDINGKLVGIVNAKSAQTNTEGLGFAVPINTAKKVAMDIIENGYVSGRCSIGIGGTTVTADNYSSYQNTELYNYIYKYYKAYGSLITGFYVTDSENVIYSSEDGTKFEYGDVIAEIGSVKVQDISSITAALSNYEIGDSVTVRVYRLVEQEVSSIFGGTRKQTTIKSFDIVVTLSEKKS